MKTKVLFLVLTLSALSLVGASGASILLDSLPQFTTASTNDIVLIQRNPNSPQRQTGAIQVGRLPGQSSGSSGSGNTLNGITNITGDVIAAGPGTAASTIQPGAVTTGKIGAGAVTTSNLAEGNVTTSKLQDGGVIGDKVANRTITDQKVEHGTDVITTSGATITFSFDGDISQVTTATGSQTIAIVNKPTDVTVDRRFEIVFAPTSTLTLTWPTTVGGSPTNWNGSILTTVAANTVRVVFVEWNGAQGRVNFQDETEPIDPDLVAIGALSTTGYAKRTGTDTWALVSPIPFSDITGAVAFNGQIGGTAADPEINGITLPDGTRLAITNITDGQVLTRLGNFVGGTAPGSGTGGTNTPPLLVQRSTVTITNTVQETSLLGTLTGSATLGANFFTQGRNLHFLARGHLNTAASSPGTGEFKIKLGALVIATSGPLALPASLFVATNSWFLKGDISCWSTGVTGTVFGGGEINIKDGTTDMTIPIFWPVLSTSTVTVNTTANLVFGLTFQFGTADANNSITCQQAIMTDGPGGGGSGTGGTGGSGGTAVFANSISVDSPNFKDSNLIRYIVSGSDITALPASIVSLAYSGTNFTMNADTAKSFKATLTQNTGLLISGGQEGDVVTLRTIQNATGGWSLYGATNFVTGDQFSSTTPITISTNASKSSITRFYCAGSGAWALLGPLTGYTLP